MGSYNGLLQGLVSGIKMPSLILLSLLICFPALFVIQYMIGSTMNLFQMANIILSGFIVLTTIALSFAPIVIFFMITSSNYSFLKLLHVAILTFSGVFAMKTIIDGLKFSCEKKNVYPKLGMTIFKMWIIIFAFVSSQLAWNLRPFIGSGDLPFELFRNKQSNFFIEVIQSTANLFNPARESQNKPPENNQALDSINESNGQ
jgi:hypothetical protein